MRKKAWVVVAVITVLVVGALAAAAHWFAPMLALRDIKNAMATRDPVKLDPLVEWSTLRASVLHDAKDEIEQANEGKFLEFLRNWIGKDLAEDTVKLAGTPKGLIRLACDNEADGNFEATKNQPCVITGEVTDYGYQPTNKQRFDAVYRTDQGAVMRFVMGKNAGTGRWQLINLQWIKRAPDAKS